MKYVVLSTDNNPDYYNLLPIVCYSWLKLGYTPFVITVNHRMRPPIDGVRVIDWAPREGVKDSTLAQLSRLFAYQYFNDDDVLILGDADMIIAKDIFTAPLPASYGFDLTGRSEIPMCYVSATAAQWRELMGEFTIPDAAKSEQWETYWSTDQQLLTQRAREYGFDKITFVDRGNNNKHGLPTGRWDRHDFAHVPDDIIDVHMPRNNWDAQYQVFQKLWPDDDMGWLVEYKEKVEGWQDVAIAWEQNMNYVGKLGIYQEQLNQLEKDYPWWLESCNSWSNHRPMLLLGLSLTTGQTYEFGSGDGSTEYLRDYCKTTRPFHSYDGNMGWAKKTNSEYVENWDIQVEGVRRATMYRAGLIFLDHAPGERRNTDAIALKDAADILVLHDTEEGGAGNYQWNNALPHFKYVLHYNRHGGGAGASMVSNTIDVTVYKGLTLGAFRFDD